MVLSTEVPSYVGDRNSCIISLIIFGKALVGIHLIYFTFACESKLFVVVVSLISVGSSLYGVLHGKGDLSSEAFI